MSSTECLVDLLVVSAVSGPTVHKRPDIVESPKGRLPVGIYELTRACKGTL